jgi:MYXO-CTERM domain-containing protein
MRQAAHLLAAGRRWHHAALALGSGLAVWTAAPAAHAADAATAQASISNVTVSLVALDAEPWVTGAWPWIVQNTAKNWPAVAESTSVSADLADTAQHDESAGWIGTSRNVAITSTNASAGASVTFSGSDLFSAGAASSFASASGGNFAGSTARLWDAAFMVGGRTRVVVTMTVDGLSAIGNGGTAMALASLGLWGPGLDTGFVNAQAQVIDSPDFSVTYDGPYTLSVNWDNPSKDMVVANISLLTSAQALSAVAAPVPEPASAALWLAGLVAVAAVARRRSHR